MNHMMQLGYMLSHMSTFCTTKKIESNVAINVFKMRSWKECSILN